MEFCRNLSPEESRWFDSLAADERDSLCGMSPVQQLQDLLRLLWADAQERLRGRLEDVPANDNLRLAFSTRANRLQHGSWARVRALMVPDNLV